MVWCRARGPPRYHKSEVSGCGGPSAIYMGVSVVHFGAKGWHPSLGRVVAAVFTDWGRLTSGGDVRGSLGQL